MPGAGATGLLLQEPDTAGNSDWLVHYSAVIIAISSERLSRLIWCVLRMRHKTTQCIVWFTVTWVFGRIPVSVGVGISLMKCLTSDLKVFLVHNIQMYIVYKYYCRQIHSTPFPMGAAIVVWSRQLFLHEVGVDGIWLKTSIGIPLYFF